MAINLDAVQQLLERDRELESASAALARAAQRAGGVLLIEGPPGVGKSQLMAAVRAIARKSGLTVLEARGAALEREFPFGVVRQLFEHVTMPGRGDNPEALFAGAASMAATLVGDGQMGTPPEVGDPSFGFLNGLYWLTVNLADRGPLLLCGRHPPLRPLIAWVSRVPVEAVSRACRCCW
jgi:AAA ATPase domain